MRYHFFVRRNALCLRYTEQLRFVRRQGPGGEALAVCVLREGA